MLTGSNIKERFVIGECPNAPDHWYVDWTELGPVEADITKFRLCEIVFDKIQPGELGIGYNVEYYRPKNPDMLWSFKNHSPLELANAPKFQIEQYVKWEVRWISCEAMWMVNENNRDYFKRGLFDSGTPHKVATGIILETLDQAEQFVDLMEAQFTFYTLKKTYATEW
jgi:hypothetical protein